MEWFSGIGNFLKNNAEGLQGLGAIAGGVGTAYGAYKQGKIADKIHKMNFDILQEERRRRQKADNSLNSAFNSSAYGG